MGPLFQTQATVSYVNVFNSSNRFDTGNSAVVTIGGHHIHPYILPELCRQLNANNGVHVLVTSFPNRFWLTFGSRSGVTNYCGHATMAAVKGLYESGYIKPNVWVELHTAYTGPIFGRISSNSIVKLSLPKAGFDSRKYKPDDEYFNILGIPHSQTYRNELGDLITIVSDVNIFRSSFERTNMLALKTFSEQNAIRGSALTVISDSDSADYLIAYTAPTCGITKDECVSLATSLALVWQHQKLAMSMKLAYEYGGHRTVIPVRIRKDRIEIRGSTLAVLAAGKMTIDERF